MSSKQTMGFQTEAKRLLQLMIHSLYSNREIFLRELISNASDAIDKRRFAAIEDSSLDVGSEGYEIRVDVDEAGKTLSISDNGIGMSRDDIIDNLGTEVIDDIVSRHTNTVVANGQGLARFIDIDTDFITLATDVKRTIFDGCKPPFINGIRRVRNKFSKENFPVGIKRVNHQLKQSFCFGLKSHSLL